MLLELARMVLGRVRDLFRPRAALVVESPLLRPQLVALQRAAPVVILDLGRREVVRIGVTTNPSGLFASQSSVEAVADRDQRAPGFLIRDRDSLYDADFRSCVSACGTKCLLTPPRAHLARARRQPTSRGSARQMRLSATAPDSPSDGFPGSLQPVLPTTFPTTPA